jgi:hypothetical protein
MYPVLRIIGHGDVAYGVINPLYALINAKNIQPSLAGTPHIIKSWENAGNIAQACITLPGIKYLAR